MTLTPDEFPTPAQTINFCLGRIVITPGAIAAMERSGEDPLLFIVRHGRGDWGEVNSADEAMNNAAVANEGDPDRRYRVLSAYQTSLGERIWVITEADRSSTCVLLPDEY